VTAFNIAVSGKDGETILHLYPDGGKNSLLERSDHTLLPRADVKVETWSLARVLKTIGSPVNLLKMDIEGMEYQAFLSCPPEELQRVERIVLEYHDELVHTAHNVSMLVNFLNVNGFFTRFCPGRDILVAERRSAH
jgi:hypothetical protein